MEEQTILTFLGLAEKLKCNLRHSWTSSGRQESVAEHTYRLLVFAWLLQDVYPELNLKKMLLLALFHDMGEAVTGDIPAFEKTRAHEETERKVLEQIPVLLPEPRKGELKDLFRELEENRTTEARLVKAMDKLEALIQHNEADLSTWLPLEYDLQLTYGEKETKDLPFMAALRKKINRDTLDKVAAEKKED